MPYPPTDQVIMHTAGAVFMADLVLWNYKEHTACDVADEYNNQMYGDWKV